MASEFQFVEGARRPFFAIQVRSVLTNAAVSLSGATVRFYWAEEKDLETKVVDAGTVTVTDAAAGQCEFRWGASDLPRPGFFRAIFEIEFSDGKKQPVQIPNVVVLPKVG